MYSIKISHDESIELVTALLHTTYNMERLADQWREHKTDTTPERNQAVVERLEQRRETIMKIIERINKAEYIV